MFFRSRITIMSYCRHASFLLAAVAVWMAVGASDARAQQPPEDGDVLYGALVLATRSDHPQPAPDALKTEAADMQKIFGYNQFQLLGEKKKSVPTGQEDWLVASRQFILNVDTQRKIVGGYALALKLLEEDRVLIGADVKLRREHPLYIRGPFVGDGQILILLTVL